MFKIHLLRGEVGQGVGGEGFLSADGELSNFLFYGSETSKHHNMLLGFWADLLSSKLEMPDITKKTTSVCWIHGQNVLLSFRFRNTWILALALTIILLNITLAINFFWAHWTDTHVILSPPPPLPFHNSVSLSLKHILPYSSYRNVPTGKHLWSLGGGILRILFQRAVWKSLERAASALNW